MLGTLHPPGAARAFNSRDVLAGLILGLAVALGLWAAGVRSPHGLHPGVLGLAANYGAVLLSRAARLRNQSPPR